MQLAATGNRHLVYKYSTGGGVILFCDAKNIRMTTTHELIPWSLHGRYERRVGTREWQQASGTSMKI